MPKDLAIFLASGLVVVHVTLRMLLYRLFSRGNPLIFSKTGVYLKPFIYEYWHDIDGYSFKRYDGLHRTTFSKRGSGITVVIYNKGPYQRTINLRGQSFTATCGIFFEADQINAVETIFAQYGVERRVLGDEL